MVSQDDERGQLLIIVALAIATMLVALALVLNAAIFTENLSTRESTDAQSANAHTVDTETAVADAYERANGAGAGTADDAEAEFNDSMAAWVDAKDEDAALQSTVFEVNWTGHMGWRLQQTEDGSFVPADNASATGWTAADGARNVSTFELNVTRADLYDGDTGFADIENEAFRLNVSNDTDEWEVYVFRDTGNSTVVVHVGDLGTFSTLDDVLDDPDTCTRTTSRAVIDLRAGTVNGTDCSALTFAGGLAGRLDVSYENVQNSSGTERVNGTYTLVVNGSDAVATDAGGQPEKFNASGSDPPTATAVVYAARYDTRYEREGVIHDRAGRYGPREEAR